MPRVLVCGGRDFSDYERVDDYLASLYPPPTAIIHGCARGADSLASRWARENAVPEVCFKADWNKNGKAAGPIRNAEMLAKGKPDLVVAFPGGRGTADMVAKAIAAGVEVAYA